MNWGVNEWEKIAIYSNEKFLKEAVRIAEGILSPSVLLILKQEIKLYLFESGRGNRKV